MSRQRDPWFLIVAGVVMLVFLCAVGVVGNMPILSWKFLLGCLVFLGMEVLIGRIWR